MRAPKCKQHLRQIAQKLEFIQREMAMLMFGDDGESEDAWMIEQLEPAEEARACAQDLVDKLLEKCAPCEDLFAALGRLAAGPGSDAAGDENHTFVAGGDVEYRIPSARWEYFPSAAKPKFVLVWSEHGMHCFDYHECDFFLKMPKDVPQ